MCDTMIAWVGENTEKNTKNSMTFSNVLLSTLEFSTIRFLNEEGIRRLNTEKSLQDVFLMLWNIEKRFWLSDLLEYKVDVDWFDWVFFVKKRKNSLLLSLKNEKLFIEKELVIRSNWTINRCYIDSLKKVGTREQIKTIWKQRENDNIYLSLNKKKFSGILNDLFNNYYILHENNIFLDGVKYKGENDQIVWFEDEIQKLYNNFLAKLFPEMDLSDFNKYLWNFEVYRKIDGNIDGLFLYKDLIRLRTSNYEIFLSKNKRWNGWKVKKRYSWFDKLEWLSIKDFHRIVIDFLSQPNITIQYIDSD